LGGISKQNKTTTNLVLKIIDTPDAHRRQNFSAWDIGLKLVTLPWLEINIDVAQLMIWHKEKWLSPIMKGFMDTALGANIRYPALC